jgi:hypothetical protein
MKELLEMTSLETEAFAPTRLDGDPGINVVDSAGG